jgi:hypothetical protein
MKHMRLTRRSVLRGAAVATAGAGAELLLPPLTASAASTHARSSTPRAKVVAPRNIAFSDTASPNGWPINLRSDAGGSVWTRPVPGTGFSVQLSIGLPELILVHVIRRFHYEISTLGAGDVMGFAQAIGLRGHELNHASGTAIDIRPGHYPVGTRGGFYPNELIVLRDILAECEGVVLWGGDFAKPNEAHFHIDLPPADARVISLAARLRDWKVTPGRGAGAIPHRYRR